MQESDRADCGCLHPKVAGCEHDKSEVVSRNSYGSTVEDRDVPSPVAPIPAHDRPSAARGGSSAWDDTSGPVNGPSAGQQTLLARCPACESSIKGTRLQIIDHQEHRLSICKDEWHVH